MVSVFSVGVPVFVVRDDPFQIVKKKTKESLLRNVGNFSALSMLL